MAVELNLLPDIKKEYQKSKRQRNMVISISILASVIAIGIVVVLLLVMAGLNVQKTVLMSQIGYTDGSSKPDPNSYLGKINAAQNNSKQDLNSILTVQNSLAQISVLKSKQPVFSRLFYGSDSDKGFLAQMNPANPIVVSLQQVQIGATAGSNSGTSTTTSSNTIQFQGTAYNSSNPNASFDALNTYIATLQNTTISYSSPATGNKVVTENLFTNVTVNQQSLSQGSSQSGNSPVSFTITAQYNIAAFAVDSSNISLKVPQKSSSDAIENAPTSVFNDSSVSQGGQQ